MKNILCMLGFHKPDEITYQQETRYHKNGKKYHKNYTFCQRCGKRLHSFAIKKEGK